MKATANTQAATNAQAGRLFSFDIARAKQPRTPAALLDFLAREEAKHDPSERVEVSRLSQGVGAKAVWVRFHDGDKQPVTLRVVSGTNSELTWVEIITNFMRAVKDPARKVYLGKRTAFRGMHYVGRVEGEPVYFIYLGRP